jgi:hypothetical protein
MQEVIKQATLLVTVNFRESRTQSERDMNN